MKYSTMSETEYCDSILNRLNRLISTKGRKQLELAKELNMSQSTLSKLLKGEVKLTLQHIFNFCKILDIDPGVLLSFHHSDEPEFLQQADTGLISSKYINDQILIRNTKHPVFKGYLDHTFYVYCYPTISSESGLLEGILTFQDTELHNYCSANLRLFTGQTAANGDKIFKSYSGELIISLTMGACYCLLINYEIGEICFLNFQHTFLFHQDLVCRVATMVSTSSGGNRLPVMQRILISKEKLSINNPSSEDFKFVRGQLRLNESEMLMPSGTLDALLKDTDSVSGDVKEFLKQCGSFLENAEYESLEEGKIRNIEVSSDVKAQGISLLRNHSIAPKYNKVSTKTEEFVFQYIDGKKQTK